MYKLNSKTLNLESLSFVEAYTKDNNLGSMKILSLDGGGMRGLFSLHILKYICEKFYGSSGELSTKKFISNFDLISGTSTGSIIAMGLSRGKSIDDLISLYKSLGTNIFSGNPYLYNPFRYARYFYGSGYYNPNILKSILEKEYGTSLMYSSHKRGIPSIFIPITDSSSSPWTGYVSRSYQNSDSVIEGSCSLSIVDTIMASCSAPTYFPEYVIGSKSYVDGGCTFNNPTELAIFEAYNLSKVLEYEGTVPSFILSIGTGSISPREHSKSSVSIIYDLIQVAIESEFTHKRVYEWCKENKVTYHRFNPPNLGEISLDETRDYVLENGEIITQKYISSINTEVLSMYKYLI